jgi:hypothetical protein
MYSDDIAHYFNNPFSLSLLLFSQGWAVPGDIRLGADSFSHKGVISIEY